MPVLHVPTLRESAYNTPAETPNNKSLRRLQKLRTTSRITEESYRHFWHVNQGEAYLAQTGKRHDSTKVMRGFGDASVLEVIESQAGNAYRAVYTVRFAAAVIVLHVFQKKSKSGIETPKPNMDLIETRLKKAAEIMKERK
jgi:phage-related protein